jgi:hypothetical protein
MRVEQMSRKELEQEVLRLRRKSTAHKQHIRCMNRRITELYLIIDQMEKPDPKYIRLVPVPKPVEPSNVEITCCG